ncbi:CCA tRNA nucleotidyltransferase [Aerococcus sp. UMB7834]|uniref:CCA tRNA nucleotidyltransferase n=1 Tax=Aerococcus sp. UMB7834 TaxID=3046342 RepID=UPI0025517150|nr:CCA tRNA nucleotidyltransferase [Aerococcus sp. UMB7834]MDK6804612.1 CCA tRNA nucleotidyltransferase [Aerococcus sp. UMB7834]
MIQDPVFQQALPVLKALEAAGYEAYFVGGAIRDALLGLPIHDVDIATSAYPQEVQEVFPKHFDVGLEHGTVMAWYEGETYEITTFRTESGYQDYRRPDKVEFVQSLQEDLLRRDFTMNALAMASDGRIIDYFEGQEAIKEGRIEAVGVANERFHEDALRMMRAVRFASQLDFDIAEETSQALKTNAPLLEKIAIERILVEMNKLWQGKNWQKGLAQMLEADLWAYCPYLDRQVLEAMLKLLAASPFADSDMAWAFYLYLDLGPAADRQAYNQASHQLARAWKMSKREDQHIAGLAYALAVRQGLSVWDPEALYPLGFDLAWQVEKVLDQEEAEGSLLSQSFSPANLVACQENWQALPIHSLKDLAVNGSDLIQAFHPQEGAQIGRWLGALEAAVLAGQVANDKASLLAWLKEEIATEEEHL